MLTFDARTRPWRVSRKSGRTIYAMAGEIPSDRDVLIGMMDTEALAACAVADHNARLKSVTP